MLGARTRSRDDLVRSFPGLDISGCVCVLSAARRQFAIVAWHHRAGKFEIRGEERSGGEERRSGERVRSMETEVELEAPMNQASGGVDARSVFEE